MSIIPSNLIILATLLAQGIFREGMAEGISLTSDKPFTEKSQARGATEQQLAQATAATICLSDMLQVQELNQHLISEQAQQAHSLSH